MKKKNKTIIILTILFTILSIFVLTNKTEILDNQIHTYILSIRNNTLTNIFKTITNLSSAPVLLGIIILSLIVIKNKMIGKTLFINLSGGFLLNQITKVIFTRTRPSGINLVHANGYSYPSGHSMISLIFYGYIIYLIHKSNIDKSKKILINISLTVLIILIGASRVYLGVHYLTDIIGGFNLAIIYLLIMTNIKLEKKW